MSEAISGHTAAAPVLDPAIRATYDLRIPEQILDVLVEEFAFRLGLQQSVVSLRRHFEIAICLAPDKGDVQFTCASS
jgi:hypothetical protein